MDNMNSTNSVNDSIADYIEVSSHNTAQSLAAIELTLKAIARRDGLVISQSSLKDLVEAEKKKDTSSKSNRSNTSNSSKKDKNKTNFDDYFTWDKKRGRARAGKMFDKLTDDFEDALSEALYGSAHPLKSNLEKSVAAFAKSLNTDVDHLGQELGKRFGNALKGDRFVKQWTKETKDLQNFATNFVNNSLSKVSSALGGGELDFSGFFEQDRSEDSPQVQDIENAASQFTDSMTENVDRIIDAILDQESSRQVAEEAAKNTVDLEDKDYDIKDTSISRLSDLVPARIKGAIDKLPMSDKLKGSASGMIDKGLDFAKSNGTVGQLTKNLTSLGSKSGPIASIGKAAGGLISKLGGASGALAALPIPWLHIGLVGAAVAVDKLSEAMSPAIEGFKSFAGSISNAADRDINTRTKYVEFRKKRIEEDTKSIREAAYTVIKDSANRVQQVWDSILTTVSATQQLDKAGVQDLWSSYAERLKQDQLSSMISSADIMEKLQSVLQQGLSGQVAEEFAYQATLLNNAIPTEDFFQYASTYASIAANAIKSGASQEEALKLANAELGAFANNLLYASRELAGGFSTSLTNGSKLFEDAAKIAMTSRIGDVSDISGVLTSVSGIVGSIAPDMAESIVDAVTQAALGGNSSELTALRSLAGTGASNTAFLQALARDPQQVFSTLFGNLAQLQNMSSTNYMEVAEALSSVFGISMDAFARVDFEYLGQQIKEMNIQSGELQENMDALMSGQTTSTESQLRMQKINEYMVEQGLAYVLDNEVARSIQEHMWQEQIAQEMTEAQYSVDIRGGFYDLMLGIRNTITKIGNVLDPKSWFKRARNVMLTALEAANADKDLRTLLEKNVVGAGNEQSLYNLTTQGRRLNLANSYLSQLDSIVKGSASISSLLGAALSSNSNKYYTEQRIGKSAASLLQSGDWRTDATRSLTWVSDAERDKIEAETATEDDAKTLSKEIFDSIEKYVSDADTLTHDLNKLRRNIKSSELDNLIKRDQDAYKENKNKILHRNYYSQSALESKVTDFIAKYGDESTSFIEWARQFTNLSSKATNQQIMTELQSRLDPFGATVEDIEAIYDEQENAKSSARTKARELHEVQFWEDMQQFATKDFPWYMREWERYYIQHEAYTTGTKNAYTAAVDLKDLNTKEQGDAVLALANALTENLIWQQEKEKEDVLKDPVLQTNVLLSKILLTVEAIMQQGNESAIVSVPTSLSALGLGVTSSGAANKSAAKSSSKK